MIDLRRGHSKRDWSHSTFCGIKTPFTQRIWRTLEFGRKEINIFSQSIRITVQTKVIKCVVNWIYALSVRDAYLLNVDCGSCYAYNMNKTAILNAIYQIGNSFNYCNEMWYWCMQLLVYVSLLILKISFVSHNDYRIIRSALAATGKYYKF